MIMWKGGWIELSIFLIILFHNLVIGRMDSIGFESEMIFILVFFLFFKNCNYDSTLLGGAKPYVLVHHSLFIFILWDLFHFFEKNVSIKDLLSFRRKKNYGWLRYVRFGPNFFSVPSWAHQLLDWKCSMHGYDPICRSKLE